MKDPGSAWMVNAACRGKPSEMFYLGRGASEEPALRLCDSCPVIRQCRQYADFHEEEYGIWGGEVRFRRWDTKQREAQQSQRVEREDL